MMKTKTPPFLKGSVGREAKAVGVLGNRSRSPPLPRRQPHGLWDRYSLVEGANLNSLKGNQNMTSNREIKSLIHA